MTPTPRGQPIHLFKELTMLTRLQIIIALSLTALLYACTIWFADDTPTKNRTDPFGMSGKTELNGDWKYVPCNGTTKNCGRLG